MNRQQMLILLASQSKKTKQNKYIKNCSNLIEECKRLISDWSSHPTNHQDDIRNSILDSYGIAQLMVDFFERNSFFSKHICETGKAIFERCVLLCSNNAEFANIIQCCQECISQCNPNLW